MDPTSELLEVEDLPMYYLGEEDLYMIWGGWNFTRQEWILFLDT